jgi:nucleotide-binding universal stress UspA family protein
MSRSASNSEEERRSAPIVVGVDGSNASRRALEWAVREAECRGNTVLAIGTYQIPAMATATPGFVFDPATMAELADLCRKVMATEFSEATKGHASVRISARVLEGPAAPTRIDASAQASALVVGARGHGGFVGLLLGSVSQHCVNHAHCPVVVIRPFSEPAEGAASDSGEPGHEVAA